MIRTKQIKNIPKVITNKSKNSSTTVTKNSTKKSIGINTVELQVLLDNTPMGVYLIDSEFTILAVNPIALPIFGKIPHLIGRNLDKVMHELWSKIYADEVIQLFRHTLITGEPYYTPERIEKRRDSGVIEYYEWQINRIPLPNGRNGVVCYFRDVSAQTFNRLALLKSEEKYRTLFESIDEGFCLLEILFDDLDKAYDYVFLEANAAFQKQSSLSDVVGRSILEIVPDLEPQWIKMYGQVAKTGEPIRFEADVVSMARFFDIYAFNSGVNKVAVVFNDITERKRQEHHAAFLTELTEALAFLESPDEIVRITGQLLSAHLDIGFFNVVDVKLDRGEDPAEARFTITSSWEREGLINPHTSYRAGDYLSEEFLRAARAGETIVVHDTDTDPRADAQAHRAIGMRAYVSVPILKDNMWPGLITVLTPAPRDWRPDEVELIVNLVHRVFLRIERARAEEELRESENRLKLALDAAEIGTFLWYPQEDRTEEDARLLTLLGVHDGVNLTLKHYLVTKIHPDDRDKYAKAVEHAINPNGNRKLNLDYRIYHQDGSLHWVHIFGNVYFSEEIPSRALKMYGMVLDITDRKRSENEQRQQFEMEKQMELLTAQRNALIKISKAKDEFIALASHQLRTPATAVKQYISLLRDNYAGPLNTAQSEFLKTAYNSNERQLTVINDLLKTAQIDSNTYSFDKKYHNIVSIVAGAIDDLQANFKLRNQTIILNSTDKIIPIMVDPTEIKLVIVNILENASKYSYPDTEIIVFIEKKVKYLHISVTDNGVGINKDNKQRIFDKFTRIDNELSDTVSGSGLGLYWVKQIVEMHNGIITVTSELKKGSTFTVKLPL